MKKKHEIEIPKLADWILRLLLPPNDLLYFRGDFEEVYTEIRNDKGILYGYAWFYYQFFKTVPFLIIENLIWSLIMFSNYLKITFRNIVRNKSYSFINIFGLATGLASCLIIFLFVSYETSFDSWHTKADRIYRVIGTENNPSGIKYEFATQFPYTEAMRTDFPDLENISQVFYVEETQITIDNEIFVENNLLYADPEFLQMFDYEFVMGDASTALNEPNSIIITEEFAKKHFGSKSPLGKMITIDNSLELYISGVISKPPPNTVLPCAMLANIKSLSEEYVGFDITKWNITHSSNATYVLLKEGQDPAGVIERFEAFEKKHMSERSAGRSKKSLQPLRDIHNNTLYPSNVYATSNETILIFALIGLLILIIASINFVNLTTAQTIKRSKEVGVRKVLGAHRFQLIKQFLSESLSFTVISIILSLIIAGLFVGKLNEFLGNGVELSLFSNYSIILFLPLIFILVLILTGVYPSLVLSRFNPTNSFKNSAILKKNSTFSLRNILVVFQFVISQVLIISTIVISSQLDYFKNRDLGFSKDMIVNVYIPDTDKSKTEVLRNKLLANPRILNLSYAMAPPTSDQRMNSYCMLSENNPEGELVQILPVDENYLRNFEISLAAGSNFKNLIEGDTLYKYVVNETLVKRMGLSNPNEAIGKYISLSRYRGEIIGVVNDFHLTSLEENIRPLILTNLFSRYAENMSVKISPVGVPETLEFIQESWEEIFPDYSYNMEFYDEFLGNMYEAEERIFTIIQVFAILAIIIGCLGLLGLISFIAVQKTKEIGIRKVMGASVPTILGLLSKEFTKSVMIANIIAWPIAWYAMNEWLQNFAYRIDISPWVFVISGAIALIISLLTVSYQSIKAAVANPVNSIRYE